MLKHGVGDDVSVIYDGFRQSFLHISAQTLFKNKYDSYT